MTLALIVPDGIGVKNYLFSEFPELFLKNPSSKIILFCSFPDQTAITNIQKKFSDQMVVVKLPAYNENIRAKLYRETISYARLKYFTRKLNNHTILKAKAQASTLRKKIFLFISQKILGTLFSFKYSYIQKLEETNNKFLATINVDTQIDLLRKYKIDALLSLHQRSELNIPFYEAAKRLGIYRFAVIYSWDNVAKARLFSPAETYMLWSKFMKRQMELFYPEIEPAKMIITGTPQFSFYLLDSWQPDIDIFCKKWGIDKNKPLVLFSGSDKRTSPFDPELLRDVAQAVLKIDEEKRPQLVFRRSPADFSERYDWVLHEYAFIKSIDPIWINDGTNWTTALPDPQDIKNLRGLLTLASVVINVSSTMALDAAIFSKPCIYIAYSPPEAINNGFDYEYEIHQEDHFKIMKEMSAVEYVRSASSLSTLIEKIIERPDDFAIGKADYLASITDNLLVEAPANIVQTIYEKATMR